MPDDAPSHIGKYVLRRRIARGGMAEVYEADDPDLHRRVALKVLRGADEAPMLAKRLHREAEIAARLRHPGIVDVYDVGVAGDTHYIAMEYVPGRTLTEVMTDGSTPRRRLIEMIRDVARAVAFAHAQGVIHRDLKPGNVLVDPQGRVRLTDFGLARDESLEVRLTRSHAILGTPQYMAPEQVEGRTREISPRTDVFALGVVLYEILSGRPPFSAANAAGLYSKILHSEPDRLSRVDADLEIVVAKALEKSPSRRYADAGAFADDLDRYLRGEPIHARPASHFYRLWKLVSRRRAVLFTAAVGVLAAATVAILVVPRWLRERRDRETAERKRAEDLAVQQEIGLLWLEVVLARQALYQSGEEPARARARMEKALDRVLDFIRRHPDLPQGRYVRARGFVYLDDLAAAEEELRGLPRTGPVAALLARIRMEQYSRMHYGDPRVRGEADPRLLEEGRDLLERSDGDSWGLPRTREDEVAETIVRALQVRYAEGKKSEARDLVLEANRREPSEEYCNLLGLWAATNAEGIEWQDQAIRRMPHYAKALHDRGVTWLYANEPKKGLEDLNRALEIQPRSAMTLVARAAAYSMLEDYATAIADCTRALEIDPRSGDAYYNRGHAHFKAGRPAEAAEDMRRSAEIRPSAMIFLNLGRAHLESGKPEWAVRDCTRAIELDSKDAWSWLTRGTAHHILGDLASAARDLDEAARLDPDRLEVYSERAEVRGKLKDYRGSHSDYDRVLELDPKRLHARVNRGSYRAMARDFDGALEDFEQAIRQDPKYVRAYIGRGMVREARGDAAGAIADYERAIELEPRNPEGYFSRGLAKRDKADLRKALEVAPPDWPHRERIRKMLGD